MRKLFVLLSLMLIATGSTVCFVKNENKVSKPEQAIVSEKIVEEVNDNSQSNEEQQGKEENVPKDQNPDFKENKKEIVKDTPKTQMSTNKSSSKTESSQNTTSKTIPQEEKPKANQNTQSNNSNQSNNTIQSNNNASSNPPQKNVVSTTFYDSITGGKKEFSSESEAFARGTQIQNNELNYVLDWNEAHPDNQIQPDINYFRVYPSAIDENGKYWYYLHFFCQSGEGNDAKLKSKY